MQITSVESFTEWLVKELQPLCDAEPSALAKYVLALIRKPYRSDDDLKEGCSTQLDVFLQGHTKRFIDKMVSVLKDDSYIAKSSPESTAPPEPVKEVVEEPKTKEIPEIPSTNKSDKEPVKRKPLAPSVSRREERDRPVRKRISPPPSDAKSRDTRDQRRRSRSPRDRRLRGRRSPEHSRRHGRRSRSTSRSPDRRKSDEERSKRRCRDFDEKGFCVRADKCMYDHGPDPLVLDHETAMENIVKGPKGPTPNFSVPPPGYSPLNPPPPGVDSGYVAPVVEGYNPEAPALTGPNFSVPPPPLPVHLNSAPWRATPYSVPQGNVVPIPYDPSMGFDQSNVGPMRGGGFRGRGRGMMSGPPGGRFINKGDGKTIMVKKIPPEQNNITKLNEHFASFGTIVNMQVHYNGDPEAAIISYSNKSEAHDAIKSPTPVLNNRFIKVFWHNPDYNDANAQNNGGPMQRSQLNSGLQVEKPVPPVLNQPPPKRVKVATVKETKFVNPAVKESLSIAMENKKKLKEKQERYPKMQALLKKNIEYRDRLIAEQKSVLSSIRDKADTHTPAQLKKLKVLAKAYAQKLIDGKADLDKLGADVEQLKTEIAELEETLKAKADKSEQERSVTPPEKADEGTVTVVTSQNLKKSDSNDGLGTSDGIPALIIQGFEKENERDVINVLKSFEGVVDCRPFTEQQPDALLMTFLNIPSMQKILSSGVHLHGVQLNLTPHKHVTSKPDSLMTANQLLSVIDTNESDED